MILPHLDNPVSGNIISPAKYLGAKQKMDHKAVAKQIVEVIPFLLRKAGSGIRCCGSGIMPAHFHLLTLLSTGSYRLGDLAMRQSVSMATMSNSIDTLVQRGWVRKARTASDRRGVQIAITEEGVRVLSNIHRQLEEGFDHLLKNLSQEELDQLGTGLKVLRGLVEERELPLSSELRSNHSIRVISLEKE